MSRRRKGIVLGALVLAAVAGGIWYRGHRKTDPPPPDIPTEGATPEVAEAIRKAREDVLARPRDGRAWGDLASLLVANSFFEQSIPFLERAEQLDLANPAWPLLHGTMLIQLSKPAEAVPFLEKALSACRNPEQRAAVAFIQTQNNTDLGRLDEAGESLRLLHELEGESPRWNFAAGVYEAARGNRERARTHLLAVADHPSARRQAAAMLASLAADPAEADRYRSRVVGASQDQPWSNSFDDAVRRFRVTPTDGLERVRVLQAEGHRQEAIDHLRDVLARSPTDVAAFMLGYTLTPLGDFAGAEAAFRQAIALNPKHAKARLFLGMVLFEQGEIEHAKGNGKAAALFRDAVEQERLAVEAGSDSAMSHLLSGRALVRLGEPNRARQFFRTAVAMDPTLFEAHLALGELAAAEGMIPEAIGHFENAVRTAPPENPEPKQTLEKWKAKLKEPK